jgi:hypothetical protein
MKYGILFWPPVHSNLIKSRPISERDKQGGHSGSIYPSIKKEGVSTKQHGYGTQQFNIPGIM